MIGTKSTFAEMVNSPVRQIKARVELLEGSTLLNTFTYEDRLISFEVQRAGAGKFFGYGICQRLNVKLIDTNRELNISTANTLEIVLGVDSDYDYFLPLFKVSEVHRDEQTNELSITAYDWLYQAANHYTSEIQLNRYSLKTYAAAAANLIGLNLRLEGYAEYDHTFDTYYPSGANLEGTETIRQALDAIAEATQSIYYVNNQWELVFKRLGGEAALTIDKSMYFTLSSQTNRKLTAICHTTELGDNVSASLSAIGSTQYIRDNPFWEMREDIADLVDAALSAVGGFTLNQFELDWRGNFLLDLGDRIDLVTKDNAVVTSFLLDDTIAYDGAYQQHTQFKYADNEGESESNPTSLGDALKQTYARVDKANKEISIVASKADENADAIAAMLINTNSISFSVSSVEKVTTDAFGTVNGEIADLKKQVEQTITPEEVKVTISKELSNGVDKVRTATGFTFDESGLTVSKEDAELSTTISEDGMQIFRNDEAILTANNVGVDAANLHATTYLIIGSNSRFEDYKSGRTGCFLIGEV